MTTNNVNFKVKNGLDAGGDISTAGQINVNASSGPEGGQINLAKPQTTGLVGDVAIDIYDNKIRFFDKGGNARGAYIDLSVAGEFASSNLLSGSGSTGPLNYAQTVGTRQAAVSSNGTTIVSVSITTHGYPVLVTVTGDVENNSAGGWTVLQLYRESTAIGNTVHTEGSAGSENSPYSLHVIDTPSSGTYTYALKLNNSAGGTFNFGESTGPVITVVELSGPKGDTGSTGATGAAGADGIQLTALSATSPIVYNSTTGAFSLGTIDGGRIV